MEMAYHGLLPRTVYIESGASLSPGEKLWTQRIELKKCPRPLGVQRTVAGSQKYDPKFYTGEL